jgi:predicted nucleic acid-binding protein
MTRISAFWDASALVPLCTRQPLTGRVSALLKTYEAVVWWSAPVEIASALARLLRMQQITVDEWNKATSFAARLAKLWLAVQPADGVLAKAVHLVGLYDLRAADCFQLAAALDWCEDVPKGRIFLSADRRLRDAALLCGFDCPRL